jgi:hypothetical protein
MLNNSVDKCLSSNPRRTNKNKGLPREWRHPLHRLIKLQVGSVHLGILAEMIGKPLLFLFLEINKLTFEIN